MSHHIYSFEKLEIWKLARQYRIDIKRITDSFPDTEKFGLTRQIRRSSSSICYNLAEGSSKMSPIDQARYTNIAGSSLIESLDQLIEAYDLEYINEAKYIEFRLKVDTLMKLISSLYTSQITRTRTKS
jgi:four helix bundle protein